MGEAKLGNAKNSKAKQLTGSRLKGSGLSSGLKLQNPKMGALTTSGARGIKRRT